MVRTSMPLLYCQVPWQALQWGSSQCVILPVRVCLTGMHCHQSWCQVATQTVWVPAAPQPENGKCLGIANAVRMAGHGCQPAAVLHTTTSAWHAGAEHNCSGCYRGGRTIGFYIDAPHIALSKPPNLPFRLPAFSATCCPTVLLGDCPDRT